MIDKFKIAYKDIPLWMQQGVGSWNKGNIELDNGSKVVCSTTTVNAIRGMTYNLVLLDEFAHVLDSIANDFYKSAYPTISSGKTSKLIIISTPKGMNLFFKIWNDAQLGRNNFIATEIHWSDTPGRDLKWKEETLKNTSLEDFRSEFECEFIGSSNTLIAGSKLAALTYKEPIEVNDDLTIYEKPTKDHQYMITVDTAEGIEKDYSAFIIIDTTKIPYNVVGRYKSNKTKPIIFPHLIEPIAKSYNQAYVLCETNSIGAQVASCLFFDLEYENLLLCSKKGRATQVLGQGFSGNVEFGVKTTKKTKLEGCTNLKALVEENKILINDYDIISELTNFVKKGQSWQAAVGHNDDLAMCLVIFGWACMTDYFRDIHDETIRSRIYEEQKEVLEQSLIPFGFLSDGSEGEVFTDQTGDIWKVDELKFVCDNIEVLKELGYKNLNDFGSIDEYGVSMPSWEYRS